MTALSDSVDGLDAPNGSRRKPRGPNSPCLGKTVGPDRPAQTKAAQECATAASLRENPAQSGQMQGNSLAGPEGIHRKYAAVVPRRMHSSLANHGRLARLTQA